MTSQHKGRLATNRRQVRDKFGGYKKSEIKGVGLITALFHLGSESSLHDLLAAVKNQETLNVCVWESQSPYNHLCLRSDDGSELLLRLERCCCQRKGQWSMLRDPTSAASLHVFMSVDWDQRQTLCCCCESLGDRCLFPLLTYNSATPEWRKMPCRCRGSEVTNSNKHWLRKPKL